MILSMIPQVAFNTKCVSMDEIDALSCEYISCLQYVQHVLVHACIFGKRREIGQYASCALDCTKSFSILQSGLIVNKRSDEEKKEGEKVDMHG